MDELHQRGNDRAVGVQPVPAPLGDEHPHLDESRQVLINAASWAQAGKAGQFSLGPRRRWLSDHGCDQPAFAGGTEQPVPHRGAFASHVRSVG